MPATLPASTTDFEGTEVRPPASVPAAAAGPILSEREEETLHLIALGYSNKEIAARLCLSVKSVETYKARGWEKAGIRTRVEFVRYASRRGWLTGL